MNFEESWNMKGYSCLATGNNDEFSGQNFQILGLQDAEVSKHQIKGVSDFKGTAYDYSKLCKFCLFLILFF